MRVEGGDVLEPSDFTAMWTSSSSETPVHFLKGEGSAAGMKKGSSGVIPDDLAPRHPQTLGVGEGGTRRRKRRGWSSLIVEEVDEIWAQPYSSMTHPTARTSLKSPGS